MHHRFQPPPYVTRPSEGERPALGEGITPRNGGLMPGLIKAHWFFPLRPAKKKPTIKPLFFGGNTLGRGRLTSHES